jgi:ABC-type uncharacterized transport system substrate-binding protein
VKATTLNLEVYDPSYFVDFALAEKDAVSLEKAPSGCALNLAKPQEMNARWRESSRKSRRAGKYRKTATGRRSPTRYR